MNIVRNKMQFIVIAKYLLHKVGSVFRIVVATERGFQFFLVNLWKITLF